MKSIALPLAVLQEEGAWFARATEVRLLWVQVAADLRGTALRLLPMLEFHHDNRSPWFLLEDPRQGADAGWLGRANRLAALWEARRQAFAAEGVPMPAVTAPDPGALPRGGQDPVVGLAAFAGVLARVLGALAPPLEGVVLVLAPTLVDDPWAFENELSGLVGKEGLARARWVVVAGEELAQPMRLLASLGERGLACSCVPDPGQKERDIEGLLAAGHGGPEGQVGAAPPGVRPPSRVDDPPELPPEVRDAALREAGIDPEFLVQAPRLRTLVLGAALCLSRGEGEAAVARQREAVALCKSLSLHPAAVICQVSLASYLSGLGQPEQAVAELKDASAYAETHELPLQVGQAQLGLGLVLALGGRWSEAARAYQHSARASEQGGSPILAIEGYRLAGQLLLGQGDEEGAASHFYDALRVAEGSPPELASRSGAPEAARRLAGIYRSRNLPGPAASLEEQADRLEQGPPPVEEPPAREALDPAPDGPGRDASPPQEPWEEMP